MFLFIFNVPVRIDLYHFFLLTSFFFYLHHFFLLTSFFFFTYIIFRFLLISNRMDSENYFEKGFQKNILKKKFSKKKVLKKKFWKGFFKKKNQCSFSFSMFLFKNAKMQKCKNAKMQKCKKKEEISFEILFHEK